MLDALPPIVLAAVAVGAAALWQWAGTALMLSAVPRELSDGWRIALAAALWLPVSGAAAMALSLVHLAGRASLLAGTAVVLLASIPNARWLLQQARSGFASLLAGASRTERFVVGGALFVQVVFILFAAHPQRIYDQLNYHLVVGELVARDGQPFTGAWDPHAMFAGVVEWGLAWHRSWGGSKLFFHGLAQMAVYFATVPALILAGLLLARPTPLWFAALCLALPGVVPENSILRMAKSDGVVLTLVALALCVLPRSTPAALGLCLLSMACKLSAFHGALALGAAAVAVGYRRGAPWLALLGAAALAVQLSKNAVVFANPVYPALGALFPSWATDAWTEQYWRGFAFEHLPRWRGWLGPFFFLLPARVLAGMLLIAAVWQRPRQVKPIVVFAASYAVLWPLFYGGTIPARFVSPFSAGLIVLWWLLVAGLAQPARRRVEILSLLLAVTVCGLGWAAMNIVKWNRASAVDAYAMQWPRIHTARALQPLLEPTDTIVADAPEKFFFDAKLLYEEPLSPRERAILQGLREDAARTAAEYKVKAVIVDAGHPMSPGMQRIWDALRSRGKVLELPPDRVLFSECYFCPPR